MNKAKRLAKAKRKDFKQRIQSEQAGAKSRKEEKAERNRRFFNGEQKQPLPEDQVLLNGEAFSFESFTLLSELHTRCFFTKLGEALEKKECTHEYEITTELLKQMNVKEDKQNQIIDIFKEHGGYCDCEVMYNVVSKLYDTSIGYDEVDMF